MESDHNHNHTGLTSNDGSTVSATMLEPTVNKEKLLVIDVLVGSKRVPALIDTGAEVSVIDASLVSTTLSPSTRTVKWIDGTPLSTQGTALVSLKIQSLSVDQHFVVMKEKSLFPVILGIDFMQANQVQLSWSRRGRTMVVIRDQRVPLSTRKRQLLGWVTFAPVLTDAEATAADIAKVMNSANLDEQQKQIIEGILLESQSLFKHDL